MTHLAHPGWVYELGQEVAELTSHRHLLFGPQGFACRSRVNREYIPPSHQATTATLSSLGSGLPTAGVFVPAHGLVLESNGGLAGRSGHALISVLLDSVTWLSAVATPGHLCTSDAQKAPLLIRLPRFRPV